VKAVWPRVPSLITNPPAHHHLFLRPHQPRCQKIRLGQSADNYYKKGIKVWWLDACEPELAEENEPGSLLYHLGSGQEVGNLYPHSNQRTFFEGMQAEKETEYVMLCRSAWAGSQRFGAAVWSGDILSTFEALQAQVRAGLNIGLSGIPGGPPISAVFTTAISIRPISRNSSSAGSSSAFSAPSPSPRLPRTAHPASHLLTSESTGAANEVWSFGDKGYGIIKDILFLRERLRPYVNLQMQMAHEKHPRCVPCSLISRQTPAVPLLTTNSSSGLTSCCSGPGIRSTETQSLPSAGTTWTDAWTDKIFAGGQWLEVDAPLEKIPVYLRAGTKLPFKK